jgi:hypothetical protein
MSASRTVDLELPDVRELDLPGRLRAARTQLADRIDPEPAPRRLRRRVLWIGLFTATVSAVAWAVLARRPAELHELSAPAAPTPASTSNGAAPVTSGSTTAG